MGINIALAALQSLVDEHVGVSYKEAIEEIRAYIEEVKNTSTNTGSPQLLDAYSELECWAIENHFNNEHCANILAKIEQLRASA